MAHAAMLTAKRPYLRSRQSFRIPFHKLKSSTGKTYHKGEVMQVEYSQ